MRTLGSGDSESGTNDRGIQWTLDAFLGVLLLFAVLTTSVSAISTGEASIEDAQARQQLTQDGVDTLSAIKARGDLKAGVLYWNADECQFVAADADNPSDVFYTTVSDSGNPLAAGFGELLEGEQLAYNLNVVYETPNGLESQAVVKQGAPGEVSVTVSETVVLNDDDRVESGQRLGDLNECGDTPGYFAPDNGPDSERFNVLKFRLTIWRS